VPRIRYKRRDIMTSPRIKMKLNHRPRSVFMATSPLLKKFLKPTPEPENVKILPLRTFPGWRLLQKKSKSQEKTLAPGWTSVRV
jgi:hypothetical protein